MVIIANLDYCNGCGDCVDICPCEVLMIENEKVKIVAGKESDCVDCGACADECLNEVLSVPEKED